MGNDWLIGIALIGLIVCVLGLVWWFYRRYYPRNDIYSITKDDTNFIIKSKDEHPQVLNEIHDKVTQIYTILKDAKGNVAYSREASVNSQQQKTLIDSRAREEALIVRELHAFQLALDKIQNGLPLKVLECIGQEERNLAKSYLADEKRKEFEREISESKEYGRIAMKALDSAQQERERVDRKANENQRMQEELTQERKAVTEYDKQLKKREADLSPKEKIIIDKEYRLNQSISEVEAKKAAVDKKYEEVERAQQTLSEGRKEVKQIHNSIIQLQLGFWPSFLLDEEWADLRQLVENESVKNTDSAILLAAIHTFTAAKRDSQSRNSLYDALYQIGCALYELKTSSSNAIRDDSQIEKLAEVFNRSSEELYRIQLARPGQPTSASWMNFKPGTNTVTTVSSWAVFDNTGNTPRFRADVT